MKRKLSLLLSPISSLSSRLRRSRPGSVLIIVIVLLLLLAILGAAFISTTRTDRVASQQNVLNTDVDSTLTGIAKICEGVLVDDLNDTFGNLRGNTAYTTNTTVMNRTYYQGQAGVSPGITPNVPAAPIVSYNPGDVVNDATDPFIFYEMPQGSTGASGAVVNVAGSAWQVLNGHLPITALGSTPWLADRIPTPESGVAPIWHNLTQSIQGTPGAWVAASILGTPFEDPTMTPSTVIPSNNLCVTNPMVVGPSTPGSRALGNGFNAPAITIAGNTYVAGDADGDGIADCLLFRVPGMALDGLTWFAGVRIIDNNSAINANTAWSRDTESFYNGTVTNTWNLFQTSVGLQELINTTAATPDSINGLNAYRFGNSATASATVLDESAINGNTPPTAYDRTNTSKDYEFISQSEAYYQQLIRRIGNPGYNTAGARYQALPYSDEAALAYHFCLSNQSSLSQSVIERLLPTSLVTTAASSAYDPSLTGTWFANNFAYNSGNSTLPIRPLIVTRNPVSNYVQQIYNNNPGTGPYPSSYSQASTQPSISDPILPNYMLPYSGTTNPHFKGEWNFNAAAGTYGLNDIVTAPNETYYPNYSGPRYTFICVNPPPGTQSILYAPATVGGSAPNYTNVLNAVNTQYWQIQPWSVNPTKTNVNTATFRELFRAFWCVMAGNPSNATPFGYTADPISIYDDVANPQRMFRSPLRDPNSAAPGTASTLDVPLAGSAGAKGVTNTNGMLMRAAIAAVNAMGMRDNSQNIISKTIILKNAFVTGGNAANGTATPSNADVEVRVYSSVPQPFISEVYVNTNTGADPTGTSTTPNPTGYIAIELFNPYTSPLTLINWAVAYVNRQPVANAGKYPNLQFNVIGSIGTPAAPVVIQPSGYLLIESCKYAGAATTQPDANSAVYRPVDSGILPILATSAWTGPATPTTQPSTTGTMYQDIYMPFLENVIPGTTIVPPGQTSPSTGGELVILRPRRADGVLTSYVDPANSNAAGSESFNENDTVDLVPVDSYDFTGLQLGTAANYAVWSCIRAKGNDGYGNNLFRTTYPGKYDATATPRETATYAQLCTPGSPPTYKGGTPTTTQPSTQPSAEPTSPVFGQSSPGSNPYTNNFPPVQIYNTGVISPGFCSHFPNPTVYSDASGGAINASANAAGAVYAGAPYAHPSGGFARNGDMLDIPFIGAYRIRVVDPTDTNLPYGSNAFLEMNPLTKDCAFAVVNDSTAYAQSVGRFVPMTAHASGYAGSDYYSWSRNIFNYLTVQSSTDAYLPNFDPNLSASYYNPAAALFAYPPQNGATAKIVPPTPVLTADPTALDQTKQDSIGVEGLININTASWKVLSMLPLVPGNLAQTEALAKAIVVYRQANGPFTSIFDLNQVPGFQTAEGTISVNAPSSSAGLTSPADPAFGTNSPGSGSPLGGQEDYQGDCLELTRISNLITTRSDTFTVYIVLQGWQNVGTANAQPMVTRRYAFIVDRSAINADPTSRYAKTLVVPNN